MLPTERLGTVAMMTGEAAAGENNIFEQAIAVNGKSPTGYLNLAKIRINQKNFANALELLQNWHFT